MQTVPLRLVDPWRLDLVVRMHSHTSGERSALGRDVERGLLLPLRRGVHVGRAAFESLTPEQQHVVRMRALAAVAGPPIVFSHYSAAVAHGLPVLRTRLGRVHVTPTTRSGQAEGVAPHRFGLGSGEVEQVHGLMTTTVPRTVVDVAGIGAMEEGVMVADAALHAGLPRELLELAADLAGMRQSSRRIEDVIAFAHPGSEGAIESRGRVTMMRMGVEVPVLQQPILLPSGRRVHPDFVFPLARAAAEADGDVKYLDPTMAPDGVGAALLAEKRREDELRSLLNGLARFGWLQSASVGLLRPILARAGVGPVTPRPGIAEYAAAAREARARSVPRRAVE